jgi:hypothetical protein
MPSSYTPSLRLVLPVTGELQGAWGDTVNDGLTSLVDASIAGTAAVSMPDTNYTLTVVNELPDEARKMFVVLTGTLTATRDVICPAVSKLYFVHNSTNQSVVFKTSAGTGITVVAGAKVALYCDGTNVVNALDVGDVTLTGTQTLTNKTLNAAVLNDGYTEEVFAVTGTTPALSPTNGSIQTWTLSGNSTPTAGTWASGQSLTLMVDDDTAYTIDWSSVDVTWKTNGGTAPTLNTSGFTAIQLWKVDTVIYGARVGDA